MLVDHIIGVIIGACIGSALFHITLRYIEVWRPAKKERDKKQKDDEDDLKYKETSRRIMEDIYEQQTGMPHPDKIDRNNKQVS